VAKVEDAVKVGEEVKVKVLGVDPEKKRISLSMRAVNEEDAAEEAAEADEVVYSDEAPAAEEAPAE